MILRSTHIVCMETEAGCEQKKKGKRVDAWGYVHSDTQKQNGAEGEDYQSAKFTGVSWRVHSTHHILLYKPFDEYH
jgi:hypothetical protein